ATTQPTFYFADDVNTEFRVKPEAAMRPRLLVYPRLFCQYLFNDNYLVSFESGYLSLLKQYTIREYGDFKQDFVWDTRYKYTFFTNTFHAGYAFWRTREVRPRVFAGITQYVPLEVTEVTGRAAENRLARVEPYGQVIHRNIRALPGSLWTTTVGAGLQYYLFQVDVYYDRSLGRVEKNQFQPLYRHYSSFSATAGVNLLHLLVKSKKVKSGQQSIDDY
ncbi:MAG TPA: hypothetical protein VF646_11360, partial [Cytophagales bacterium]